MFSEELKRRTSVVHADLEKKLIPHIRQVKDREGYASLLKLMYGFYFPLQQKVEPFLPRLVHKGHSRGRQAEHIVKDITSLDGDARQSIPTSSALPVINTFANALGALYVSEGSTLGGRIIAGMISKQVPEDLSHSFSFFNAYGEDTKLIWENFRAVLNQPFSDTEKQQIVDTALETFSSFKKWLSEYDSGTNQ